MIQQGVCINPSTTTALVKGSTYFLFPAGDNYYVSRFPKEGAHTGCFPARYFRLIERQSWPPEPVAKVIQLDSAKVYTATLIWRRKGYLASELKSYTIKPKSITHCFFYDNGQLQGCYPLHWFEGFQEKDVTKSAEPVKIEKNVTEAVGNVFEPENFEQLKLF